MKHYEILPLIADAVHRTVPGATVIVYGSVARKEARPDSDIDLLVLTEGSKALTVAEELKLRSPLVMLEAENGIPINTMVVQRSEWEKHTTPFSINVRKEGVAI